MKISLSLDWDVEEEEEETWPGWKGRVKWGMVHVIGSWSDMVCHVHD